MPSFLQSFLRLKARILVTTLKMNQMSVKREKKKNQSLLKTQPTVENSALLTGSCIAFTLTNCFFESIDYFIFRVFQRFHSFFLDNISYRFFLESNDLLFRIFFFCRKDLPKYSKNAKFHGDRIIMERTARGNVSEPSKISAIEVYSTRSSCSCKD